MADGGKIKSNKIKLLKAQQNVFHPSNPVANITVWGIKHMMTELDSVKEQAVLLKNDFKAFSKVSIHNQAYNNSALPNKFAVKAYCPLVFRDLRSKFKVNAEDFVKSWGNVLEMQAFAKNHSPQYISENGQFHMKLLAREEVDLFLKTLSQYHTYVVERDGVTFLPQFLALFRTTVADKDSYLIVSRNLYSPGLPLNRIYSLKGSKVDRNASAEEAEKDLPVFKDNDFIEKAEKLVLGDEEKEIFLSTIKYDLEYLSSQKRMGYILQVAFHKYEEAPPLDLRDNVYAVGKPGPHKEQLFIGFIDVLTKYGAMKVVGHTAKVMKHGTKKAAGSTTVNPDQYSGRLLKFITENIE